MSIQEPSLHDTRAEPDVDVVLPPTRRLRRVFQRHLLGVLGCTIVAIILCMAIFGPVLYGVDPNSQSLPSRTLPPFTEGPERFHLLGTDHLGRDMFARILAGARASMGVVLAALVFGLGLGMTLGTLAGFYRGKVDTVIMRCVDAQLAVPLLVAAMFVAALLGTGFWNTALTLGIAGWPIYARLVRADALKIRGQDYIDASIALGATDKRLLGAHVVPNLVGAVIVVASLELGHLILVESALSFLGLGMQPPDASWGQMIQAGQGYVYTAWWLSAIPGVFIMVTVLGLNLMGDWLRDRFDPYTD